MGVILPSDADLCELMCPDPLMSRFEDAGINTDDEELQTATRLSDFDNAVIGYADEGRLVYGYEKLIHVCVYELEMDYEDAVDYIDHDILAWYRGYGEQPPIIMYEVNDGTEN